MQYHYPGLDQVINLRQHSKAHHRRSSAHNCRHVYFNDVLTLMDLATFFVEAMHCLPLMKLWESEVPGKCLETKTVNWVNVANGSKFGYC